MKSVSVGAADSTSQYSTQANGQNGPNKPLHTEPRAARFGEINVVRRGAVNGAVMPDLSTHASVELSADPGEPVQFKFSSPVFEINVRVPRALVHRLERAARQEWEGGSIQAGESLGSRVFWCAGEAGTINVLIGHDDETWDVAVVLPQGVFHQAVAEAMALASESSA